MSEEPYKQIEYRGHTISIFIDENPLDPREWDNLGTMYTAHRRYCPEKKLDDHFDINEVFKSQWVFSDRFLREWVALPIYLYDHSGLTVSTRPFSCPWDSGLFGIIAVGVEDVEKEWGWKSLTAERRKTIEEYLQAEVKTYGDYLTGQVYGYRITRIGDDETEISDGWGYYGYEEIKHIEQECMAEIDAIHQEDAIQRVTNFRKYAVQLCLPFEEYQLSTIRR